MSDRLESRAAKRAILWTAVQWVVGTAIAAAAVIAAFGGPANAWLELRTAMWGHPPPRILSVTFAPDGPKGSYIVSLRNPALEGVLILGYRVMADVIGPGGPDAWQNASTASPENGAVTVMGADERTSSSCEGAHFTDLARPMVIEAGGVRALQVRPWKEPCVFAIAILSDHGDSDPRRSISDLHP